MNTKTLNPIEPTCQVKNLDTGVTEIMTQENAKKLQSQLCDMAVWFNPDGDKVTEGVPLDFYRNDGIYTYRLKSDIVELNGEFMSREAAVAIWESKKATCDLYYSSFEENDFCPVFGEPLWNNPGKERTEYRTQEKSIN